MLRPELADWSLPHTIVFACLFNSSTYLHPIAFQAASDPGCTCIPLFIRARMGSLLNMSSCTMVAIS